MQIEVGEAVEQECAESGDGSGVQGAGEMALIGLEVFARVAIEAPEEREAAEAAEQPRFSKGFDVVVVNMVHDPAVVLRFIAGIHGDERPQARAEDRMIEKNMRGSAKHGGAP